MKYNKNTHNANCKIPNTKLKMHLLQMRTRLRCGRMWRQQQNTMFKIQNTNAKYKIQKTEYKIENKLVADENQIEVRQNVGDKKYNVQNTIDGI